MTKATLSDEHIARKIIKGGESVDNGASARKDSAGKKRLDLIHPAMFELVYIDAPSRAHGKDVCKHESLNPDQYVYNVRALMVKTARIGFSANKEEIFENILQTIVHCLSMMSCEEITTHTADAMKYGEEYYGRNNWRKGHMYSELVAAALRHLEEIVNGNEHDKDSGNLHMAHFFGSIHMLVGNLADIAGVDDISRGADFQSAING